MAASSSNAMATAAEQNAPRSHGLDEARKGPRRRPRSAYEGVAAGLACAALSLTTATACSTIPPGRSAVDSVTIRNNRVIKASEIEEGLATQASPRFPLLLFQGIAYDYALLDESVLQRDMSRVERFYRASGFLDAHARVGRIERVSKQHVRVEIVVDEGPPILNRDLRVSGLEGVEPRVARAAMRAAMSALPRGARFDEKGFKESEAAVTRALTDRGYAWARVEAQCELDVGAHTADYGFAVRPGPAAVFGPITITGLDPDGAGPRKQELPERPLRRAIDIEPGQRYATSEIASATRALLDLGVPLAPWRSSRRWPTRRRPITPCRSR